MAMLHRNTSVWRSAVPCGPKKWAMWDEQSEESLACESIFVAMMENPTTGGNEVGMGGELSEIEKTLTQNNSVNGAIGSPPSRQVDGSKQFTIRSSVINSLLSNSPSGAWTVIIRHDVIFPSGNSSNIGWMNSLDFSRRLYTSSGLSGANEQYVPQIRGSGGICGPSNVPTGNGYWCWWCDGSAVYCGWCATKPTKLSNFLPGYVINATASDKAYPVDFIGVQFSDNFPVPYGFGRSTTEKLYYFVAASICLIDNNA